MNIVVLKSEEDTLLGDCDDSCSNDDKCVCHNIDGIHNAGQGMYDYGFTKCVLCIRSEYANESPTTDPPYRVILDGYPVTWVSENGVSFIRFMLSDYTATDHRSIKQNVPSDAVMGPASWIYKMYDTSVIKVPVSVTHWFLSICEYDDCKQNIHSYIDQHRAIGIDNSYMDLSDDTVKCKFCNNCLKYINDTNGTVEYKGMVYSRCHFCITVIHHDRCAVVQICTTCKHNQDDDLKMLERVCMYCSNTVPVNQKGGSQSITVRQVDGNVKDMFLCRHHKVRSLNNTDIYEYDQVINMLKSGHQYVKIKRKSSSYIKIA
jgi:hypothetical protein